MIILGVSAFYHDSAACLVRDGEILCAAQEERFTRRKHDAGFPTKAIQWCVEAAGVTPDQIDQVVFYEKPFLKFERLLETYLAFAPRGFRSFAASMPLWIKDKLFQKSTLIEALGETLGSEVNWEQRLRFSEHHFSHAASAFYPSPFDEAAVLTMDGVGEWTTTSLAIGKGTDLQIHKEILFPHSLGLLYSAFTYYTGFKVNSGEYKLMGLAPYGEPRYADLIRQHLIHVEEDGSFQLDLSYFDYCTGLTMTNQRFHALFGGAPRQAESHITQRDMDLAASVQQVTEEVVLKLARGIVEQTGLKNLCLAGGVALNCVANGVLQRSGIFERIWIQPAAGDAGGAIGAALAAHYSGQNSLSRPTEDAMKGAYLGPAFDDPEAKHRLEACGARYQQMEEPALLKATAEALAEGKAVGWMQGAMEFGPRALGNRSILADPRSAKMQKRLNLKVKYRESFRPFAPSVLAERVNDYFELDHASPYMLLVAGVQPALRREMTTDERARFGIDKLNVVRSGIPAVTHVDYSARVQTVHPETNPLYHQLIKAFEQQTGCGVIVNTSFNVRGEPIVCTPQDAYTCFMRTEMDHLVMGPFVLDKADQPVWQDDRDWQKEFELD